jgi:outer membrane cobalamin receptor
MFRTLAGKNRYAVFVSACLIPATCIQTAWAAEQQPEEVVVTGSRIARGSDFENPSPVLTVDREAIERSGYNNLEQLME